MRGGELLSIPSFLLFGGDSVDDLVEAFIGHGDACGIQASSEFLVESLDDVGASAQPPQLLGLVEKVRELFEFIPGLGHQLGVTFAPLLLKLGQGTAGAVLAIGPEDGLEILGEGFLVSSLHLGEDRSHLVHDAQLVIHAQLVCHRRADGLVGVGDDQVGANQASFLEVGQKGTPAFRGLAVADKPTQEVAHAMLVDADGHQDGLFAGLSFSSYREVQGIQVKNPNAGNRLLTPLLDGGQQLVGHLRNVRGRELGTGRFTHLRGHGASRQAAQPSALTDDFDSVAHSASQERKQRGAKPTAAQYRLFQGKGTQRAGQGHGLAPVAPRPLAGVLVGRAAKVRGQFGLESVIKHGLDLRAERTLGHALESGLQGLPEERLDIFPACGSDGKVYFLHGRRALSECGGLAIATTYVHSHFYTRKAYATIRLDCGGCNPEIEK